MTGATGAREHPGAALTDERRVWPTEGEVDTSSSPPDMSLTDTTQLALDTAMRGDWARQTLITNNIANANTPGYQRETLNFQGALNAALQDGQSPTQVPLSPEVQAGSVGPEGNGVDIDQESALLSENGLEYEAIVQVMGTRDEILRSAMGVS
jgi:flagellar basal-body rod protein FlgB